MYLSSEPVKDLNVVEAINFVSFFLVKDLRVIHAKKSNFVRLKSTLRNEFCLYWIFEGPRVVFKKRKVYTCRENIIYNCPTLIQPGDVFWSTNLL